MSEVSKPHSSLDTEHAVARLEQIARHVNLNGDYPATSDELVEIANGVRGLVEQFEALQDRAEEARLAMAAAGIRPDLQDDLWKFRKYYPEEPYSVPNPANDPDGPEAFEGTLMDGLEDEPPYPATEPCSAPSDDDCECKEAHWR